MSWILEEELKGYYKSGKLPHYDNDELYQLITFRLHDSVPQVQIYKWIDELEVYDNSDKSSKELILLEKKILDFEDKGYGDCYLKNQLVYNVVQETLEKFNGERYELIEWIIMPNHVHVLIKPYKGYSLPKIVHSWKSYTANVCNKILNRKGKFWMDDYFDRYIRTEKHFNYTIEYIRNNGKKRK